MCALLWKSEQDSLLSLNIYNWPAFPPWWFAEIEQLLVLNLTFDICRAEQLRNIKNINSFLYHVDLEVMYISFKKKNKKKI